MTIWIRNVTGRCPFDDNTRGNVRLRNWIEPYPTEMCRLNGFEWCDIAPWAVTHFAFPEGTECPWMECPSVCPVDGTVLIETQTESGDVFGPMMASGRSWDLDCERGAKWRLAALDAGPVPKSFNLELARDALNGSGLSFVFRFAGSKQGFDFWWEQHQAGKLSPEGRAILLHWIAEIEARETLALPDPDELIDAAEDPSGNEKSSGAQNTSETDRVIKRKLEECSRKNSSLRAQIADRDVQLAGKDAEIARLRALLAGKPLDAPVKPFSASKNLALGPMNVGVGSSYGDRR